MATLRGLSGLQPVNGKLYKDDLTVAGWIGKALSFAEQSFSDTVWVTLDLAANFWATLASELEAAGFGEVCIDVSSHPPVLEAKNPFFARNMQDIACEYLKRVLLQAKFTPYAKDRSQRVRMEVPASIRPALTKQLLLSYSTVEFGTDDAGDYIRLVK